MDVQISEELQLFNNIEQLNWAWIYRRENGQWVQFECLQCMILESKWQSYKLNNDAEKATIKMKIGTVYFNRSPMVALR